MVVGAVNRASRFVVVIDLETLSISPGAAIGTVGAALVDVLTGEILSEFYERADLKGQDSRLRDSATMAFWAEQKLVNRLAWDEVFSTEISRRPLACVLQTFCHWMMAIQETYGEVEVMGNGPEFDNVIMVDALKWCGLDDPWHFRFNQSLRTVVWLARLLLKIDPRNIPLVPGEVQHHALHDARREAKGLYRGVNAFSERLAGGDAVLVA